MDYEVFRLCINYHDTHSNIWDLPCKSQSRASLGKFCATVVPVRVKIIVVKKRVWYNGRNDLGVKR